METEQEGSSNEKVVKIREYKNVYITYDFRLKITCDSGSVNSTHAWPGDLRTLTKPKSRVIFNSKSNVT